MAAKEREADKRVGWMVSAGVHILIVLLFFLINAWTAPDPPLPEYGIELNFGLEEAGSGAQQPVTRPSPPTVEEQGEPEKQEETKPEEIVEEQPVEQPVQSTAVEELPDSKQDDSPVETKPVEKPKIVTPVPKEEVKETKPISKPAEVTPVQEPKVEEKKVDANALYPGSSSQGSKENAAGDAGDPQGKVDARTLYGKQGGGGGGPSLDLAGWKWDYIPKPNDQSKENGRIVFEIKVDDSGVVIGVKTIERTVSPAVEQIYRREVEKLTFSRISENTIPASISTGKITFFIRSN